MEPRRFVYILRSDSNPERHYVGLTSDVARRLHWHNNGPSGMTVHHRPWSLVVSLEFADARNAERFERYMKSGSGRAFAKRHFAPQDRCSKPAHLPSALHSGVRTPVPTFGSSCALTIACGPPRHGDCEFESR